MNTIKQEFASALVRGLKNLYGGRMPSIAVVARDFSLKSPHLPHVSGETVRKWIRGECLPHVSRMQVLTEWIGPQIATPLEQPIVTLKLTRVKSAVPANGGVKTNGNGSDYNHHPIHNELVDIIDQLSEKECESILAIAKLLVEKDG